MNWMIMPLKRYADFSGRSRRKEYWMFTLGLVIFYLLIALLLGVGVSAADGGAGMDLFGGTAAIVMIVVGLAMVIPGLAVQVRRFHDQDKSGWFVLLNFIPYLGGLIVLVFMCLEGTRGHNRFGEDPKGLAHGDIFA